MSLANYCQNFCCVLQNVKEVRLKTKTPITYVKHLKLKKSIIENGYLVI